MTPRPVKDSQARWEYDVLDRIVKLERNLIAPEVEVITDRHYDFVQNSPATVWTINHGLGKYPSVETFDFDGNLIEGDVRHTSINQVVITWSGGQTGSATLN